MVKSAETGTPPPVSLVHPGTSTQNTHRNTASCARGCRKNMVKEDIIIFSALYVSDTAMLMDYVPILDMQRRIHPKGDLGKCAIKFINRIAPDRIVVAHHPIAQGKGGV